MSKIDLSSIYTEGNTYTVLSLLKKMIEELSAYDSLKYEEINIRKDVDYSTITWDDWLLNVYDFIHNAKMFWCEEYFDENDTTSRTSNICIYVNCEEHFISYINGNGDNITCNSFEELFTHITTTDDIILKRLL